ncbi:MAG: IclR family transcriptional regulator, partial [Deltaproteobacteria bacterium]
TGRGGLGTVEKAIDVLFHLHRAGAAGVTEIGRALAMPKSTAHRLLGSLARRGLVERDDRGRYRPGVGLVALGLGVLDRDPVVAAARPVLEEAARALGETVFLTAARGGRIVVLDKAEGSGFLRAAPRIGAEVPVHATAVGKLYLGFASERVSLPRGRLTAFTRNTLTKRPDLERQALAARRNGWAANREEWQPGLTVLAAPVLRGGQLEAAVAVAASSARLRAESVPHAVRHITEAARRVAARLAGGTT